MLVLSLLLLCVCLSSGELQLEPLPYAFDALEPHISQTTLREHYLKHHAGYVKKANAMIADSDKAGLSLSQLIVQSDHGPLFNNVAQIYNHAFFWRSLRGGGNAGSKGYPPEPLWAEINKRFGSMDQLKEQLKQKGLAHFGSGWLWLVKLPKGTLQVLTTSNAQTFKDPKTGIVPLLVIDLWEHAYYLDFKSARGEYLDAVINNLVDWDFANHNFAKGLPPHHDEL